MPNIYQWIVFICTIAILFFEITAYELFGISVFDFSDSTRRGRAFPNIQGLLLVGLTAFVGFFLYRVAGKAKQKKSND